MIDQLRPYARMTETGHPWFPRMPAHWELRRNGRLFAVRQEVGFPDLPILEVSLRTGVRVRDLEGGKRKQVIEDRSKYQRAARGDLAYNMMRMWQGAMGLVPEDGLVSPAYVVVRTREDVHAAYYAYLFRTAAYMAEIDSFSRGIVPDRNRLYPDAFKQMLSAYPMPEEQRLIVRFLDWHGAMTARLIRAKKRLIAVLNEQKQSIIHRAVTRGLNPEVKLKPSGVDFLGDVPERWQLKPLKWWADINRTALGKNTDPDYAFDYLDISAVGTGFLKAEPERLTFAASPSRARRVVQQYDTLISTVRTYLKAIYFVANAHPDLIASTGFAVLTPHSNIDPRFFGYALQGRAFLDQVIWSSDGVAYPAINETRLGTMKLALPPTRDEQSAIIQHLERETAFADRGVATAKREIAIIEEFRTRLIADVVTGQLDVQKAAALLPDPTEDIAVLTADDEPDLDEVEDDEDAEEKVAA